MSNSTGLSIKPIKSVFLRGMLIACGWVCTAAGVAGIFLPLVPTVPFLLLATACFARSSVRFHTWLTGHHRLGPLLRDYLKGAGIPLSVKRVAICAVWVSFLITTFLLVQGLWLRLVLIATAVVITLYLLSLPTAATDDQTG